MKRFSLVAILPIVVTAATAAQSPSRQSGQTVFRSGASLVAVNVTVLDADKRYVTGLHADDFAVYENGIRQDVQFFESSSVPIDLIILLDASASMRHRMEVVHEAALGFLNTLREGDRGAVVAFNDGVAFLEQLTRDRSALAAAVRGTIAGGGTALHNALYVSLKQFGRKARDAGDIRRQAIAVLSDGEDTASLVSFDDVLEVARRSGVSIYPISLASEYSEAREQSGRRYFSESQYSMRKLAQETGAQAFFPERIDDLAGAYASIAQELSSQYSLGYVPSNTRLDGQFRRIVVQVTSRPELRPRARTGYVAASAAAALLHQNEVR